MKMDELVKGMMAAGAGANLPEKRLARLARALLEEVGAQIDKAPEGTAVKIPGLGIFRSKTLTGKTGTPIKRIVFRPSAGRKPAADAGKARARGPAAAGRAGGAGKAGRGGRAARAGKTEG